MRAIEVEIDGPHNECLRFRPLQRSIRGRFDMMRIGDPMAKVESQKFPVPIPSQRFGIDPDGNGFIRETLHDDEFEPIREKIERDGMKLEPAVQVYEGIHVPSWLYWINRAVESGLAKVVKGQLPEKIEGKPKKNFILAEDTQPSTSDKLTAAIDRQSELFERLLAKLDEK